MVIVKCMKCGKEYELKPDNNPSDFQCDCGGNLEFKADIAHEILKSKKTTRKSLSRRRITISISLIVCLVLIISALLVIFNSGSHHVNMVTQINKSDNNTTSIANQTYSANGITFNYPADWQQIENLNSPSRWGYGDPIVAFYDPSNNATENNIYTYFYIKQRDVGSLDEMLSDYRSDIAAIGQTEISERNITVNGMKAVELKKKWTNGNIQYKALTVHIEVVPGSKYYRIGCVVPASEYNATLPKFEMVVNSFKPQ